MMLLEILVAPMELVTKPKIIFYQKLTPLESFMQYTYPSADSVTFW